MRKPRLWGRGLLRFYPPQADRRTFSKAVRVYACARFFLLCGCAGFGYAVACSSGVGRGCAGFSRTGFRWLSQWFARFRVLPLLATRRRIFACGIGTGFRLRFPKSDSA